MAIAYLVSVAIALGVLAVALRPRRGTAPTPPVAPAATAPVGGDEVRVILAAAAQLATRLDKAA